MFTTLIAVTAALALGHAAPALVAAIRRDDLYRQVLDWLRTATGHESVWAGRYGLSLAVLPPMLLVLLLQWLLRQPLWGLLGLLFGVLMLAVCWGPRDLDVDVEAVLDAPDAESRLVRLQSLASHRGQQVQEGPALAATIARSALRRWFAVLFWFLLLGPAGALLYRLVERGVAHSDALPSENAEGARTWLAWLEWPVAQLMTLTLALAGNFDRVFRSWRAHGGDARPPQSGFLEAALRAAVSGELEEDAEDFRREGYPVFLGELPELRDAMSLVWRMLLLWMALLALLVIAGWVG